MEATGADDKAMQNCVVNFHELAKRMESHDLGLGSQTAAFRCAAGMLIAVAAELHGQSDLQVRDLDVNHIYQLVPSFVANGIMKGSNLLVRQRIVDVEADEWTRIHQEYGEWHALPKLDNEPYRVRYLEVFDGNHRTKTFQDLCAAVALAIKEEKETATAPGPASTEIPAQVFSNFSLKKTFSCIVYKESCPSQDCITYATALNDLVVLAKGKSITNFLRYLSTYTNAATLAGAGADIENDAELATPTTTSTRGSATAASLKQARAAAKKQVSAVAGQVTAQLAATWKAAAGANMLEGETEPLQLKENTVKSQLALVGFLMEDGLRDVEAIASIDATALVMQQQRGNTPMLYKWGAKDVQKPSFSRYVRTAAEKALYAQVAKTSLINEFLMPTKKDSRVVRDSFVAFFLAFAAFRFFSTSKSIASVAEGDLTKDTLAGMLSFPQKPAPATSSKPKKAKGMALFTTLVAHAPHVATFHEDIAVVAMLAHERCVAKAAAGMKTPKLEISQLLREPEFALMVLLLALPLCRKANAQTGLLETVWNAEGCRSEASNLIDAFHSANPDLPSSMAGKTLKGKKSKVTQAKEAEEQANVEREERFAAASRKAELAEQRRISKEEGERRAAREKLKSEQQARKDAAGRHSGREAQQKTLAAAAVKAGRTAVPSTRTPTTRSDPIWMDTNKPTKEAYGDDEDKYNTALGDFNETKDLVGSPRMTFMDFKAFGDDPASFPNHWCVDIHAALVARPSGSVCVRVTPGAFGKAMGMIMAYSDLENVHVAPPYQIGTTLQSLTLDASDGSGGFNDSVDKFLWDGHKGEQPGTLDSIIIVLFKTTTFFLSDQKKWAASTRGIATTGEHARTHKTGGDGKEFLHLGARCKFVQSGPNHCLINMSATKLDLFPEEFALGVFLSTKLAGYSPEDQDSGDEIVVWQTGMGGDMLVQACFELRVRLVVFGDQIIPNDDTPLQKYMEVNTLINSPPVTALLCQKMTTTSRVCLVTSMARCVVATGMDLQDFLAAHTANPMDRVCDFYPWFYGGGVHEDRFNAQRDLVKDSSTLHGLFPLPIKNLSDKSGTLEYSLCLLPNAKFDDMAIANSGVRNTHMHKQNTFVFDET